MSDPGHFGRRWANRRTPAAPPPAAPPTPIELPTAAMRLLSDYEDAIYASARHALRPPDQDQSDENAHMVDAVRLHGDVRRLRIEVHSMMEGEAP